MKKRKLCGKCIIKTVCAAHSALSSSAIVFQSYFEKSNYHLVCILSSLSTTRNWQAALLAVK